MISGGSSKFRPKNQVPGQDFSKWRIYAAATGAAMAMSTGAQASMIVSSGPVNFSVFAAPGNTSFGTFSIEHHPLIVRVQNAPTNAAGFAAINNRTSSNFQFANLPLTPFLKNYLAGQPISFTGGVPNGSVPFAALFSHNSSGSHGAFGPGHGTGYIGFRDTSEHFGYIKVQVLFNGVPGYPDEVNIVEYAYNQAAGSINAGQTGVPEPGTSALSLLALGAAGIAAWRRRRDEVSVG
jgi:hypothetical protein